MLSSRRTPWIPILPAVQLAIFPMTAQVRSCASSHAGSKINNISRRGQAGSMAITFPRCSQETIFQGPRMDQNHQRYRGRSREILQGVYLTCDSDAGAWALLMLLRQGIEKFGLNVDNQNNIVYREWAPNATEAYLTGDFSKFGPTNCCSRRVVGADSFDRWLGPQLTPHEEGLVRRI